jgi:hypothetical protein
MPVSELIAELQEYLPDAPVYVRNGGPAGSFSVIVDGCVTTAVNCGMAIRTDPA